jgi:N-ethylmaleimide reductase
MLRNISKGTMISAGGFDRAGAEAILERGDTDLVAFGRFLPLTPICRSASFETCH